MTIGLTAPGLGIVACDTRFSFDDDTVRDFGAKLRRVPRGWIGVTGDAHVAMIGLRAAEELGMGEIPKLRSVTLPSIQAARIENVEREPSESVFLAVRENAAPGASLHTLYTDGTGDDCPDSTSGKFELRVSWAPGMTEGQHAAGLRRLRRKLTAAKSIPAIIRPIAEAFLWAHKHGRDMSAEIELGFSQALTNGGFRPRYLRRSAAWVANASDSKIMDALTDPPTLPSFPELDAEKRMFRIPTAAAA